MTHLAPLPRAQLSEFEPFFQLVEQGMGFVPSSLYTMGRRPELLRGFAALAGAVLGPGRLDPGLKALVSHVTSTAAGCRYCQAHTAHTAHRSGVDAEKVAAAFEYETDPRFDERERAALRVAQYAGLTPNAVEPDHMEALREHFSDEEVLEIVSVIALFGFLNRWNDTLATRLEAEPGDFARDTLAARGWSPGKHA